MKQMALLLQEAGEFDVNLGFKSIILRSKLTLYNIEVLPLWMTSFFFFFNYFVEFSLN